MRTTAFFFLLFFTSLVYGQKKQLCFTIDDLPVVALSFKSYKSQEAITAKILSVLVNHHIPASGFVNEDKLYTTGVKDTVKIKLLKMWLDSGIDLGNHSFSHLDFHHVSCTAYFEDIIKGEKLIKPLMAGYGKSPKYFRHPYLHVGESKEKADSLHFFLVNSGYIEAPVTIDNADWIFALAYDSAMVKKDTALMKSIGSSYLDYMEKKLKYYEIQAKKIYGRTIKHILLIHANAINAGYLNDLAMMYERNNYEFISLGRALEDEAYLTEVKVYGGWGISWLHRWAMSMGKKGKFFKGEPETPGYIMKLAKTTQE